MLGPALATLTVSLAAASAPPKLVVLELDSPPTMIGLAQQVTNAILDEAKKQKLSPIEPKDVRSRIGDKNYGELVRCGNKVACAAAGLVAFPEASRAVVGSLNRDEKAYLLHLTLIDLKNTEVIAEVDRPILIASRRFQHDMVTAIGPLLRGEKEEKGTLVVSSNAKNASVTVDAEFIGVAPVTIQLKPGKHEVKVEQPKYLPATRLVGVEPNQTTNAEIRLILKPGEKAEDEAPKLAAGGGDVSKPEGPSYFPSAQVWLVGGGAVVLLGVGTYFGLTEQSTEKSLREGFNATTGIYSGTRKQALDAKQDALLANVFWGIGGAVAIVTAVLVVFDVRSQSVTVTPTASPTGAGVSLSGRF